MYSCQGAQHSTHPAQPSSPHRAPAAPGAGPPSAPGCTAGVRGWESSHLPSPQEKKNNTKHPCEEAPSLKSASVCVCVGAGREGTALGKGSRLLCSQLQGGCQAGGAGGHRGTPSPAVPPPPWGRAGSPSVQHPFYFRAERPLLRPRYLPAKETEQSTLGTQLRDRNISKQILLQLMQTRALPLPSVAAGLGALKELPKYSLQAH